MMLPRKIDPPRSFSLDQFAGDGSLVSQFRVSWGSKNSRNYPYNSIGKRQFQMPSAKSAAASAPIRPIRVSTADRRTRTKISSSEAIAASGILMMANQNPWGVTKKLKASDLNSQSRLLIGKPQMRDHVLPFLDEHSITQIESNDGFKVWVKECDTHQLFQLKLKWWKTSHSYVFVDGWTKNFIARRSLNKGDEIGIFWNGSNHMFVFSVLGRAKALAS